MLDRSGYYTVGGTVQASDGVYISREADDELLRICRQGVFSYVLTSRQMGKSSLMIKTAERLTAEGTRTVIIDLTQLGTQLSAESWYLGLLTVIEDQLMLETLVDEWWAQNEALGLAQRLTSFFKDILLSEVDSRIVVFVDEIDTTLSLDFTDDFFTAIRHLYVARAQEPALKRLSFVLIGVATPSDLIRDPRRTPFNIGRRVDLSDFTREEVYPLAAGLELPNEDDTEDLHSRVFEWTRGHPYLTQRVYAELARWNDGRLSRKGIDYVVENLFFSSQDIQDNNLQFVRDMLTRRAADELEVLRTYRTVLRGKPAVRDQEQSLAKAHLKLSGVVVVKDGFLRVRNPIYRKVFSRAWVKEHLPASQLRRQVRRAAAVALVLAVLSAVMGGMAFYAFQKASEAESARKQAEAAREQAVIAREQAETARREADENSRIAQKRQREALQQRETAVRMKERAEENAERIQALLMEAERTQEALRWAQQAESERSAELRVALKAEREARQAAIAAQEDKRAAELQQALAEEKIRWLGERTGGLFLLKELKP